jgi:hypothetical protein
VKGPANLVKTFGGVLGALVAAMLLAGIGVYANVTGTQHWTRVPFDCDALRSPGPPPELPGSRLRGCISALATPPLEGADRIALLGSVEVSEVSLSTALQGQRLSKYRTFLTIERRQDDPTMLVVRRRPMAPAITQTGRYDLDRTAALDLSDSFEFAARVFGEQRNARMLYYSASPSATIAGPPMPPASFAVVADNEGHPVGYVCTILGSPDSSVGSLGLERCVLLARSGYSLHQTILPSMYSYSAPSDSSLLQVAWPWDVAIAGRSTRRRE